MPITYELDPESQLVRTRCWGNVTFDEVMGHFRELESDASLPTRLDIFLDLSSMDSLPESEQLQSVAGEFDRMQSRVKWGACAIVASRDALYGMLRVFQVFAEAHFEDSCVFRDREGAERWLESARS